jgi:hypothetical protein
MNGNARESTEIDTSQQKSSQMNASQHFSTVMNTLKQQ